MKQVIDSYQRATRQAGFIDGFYERFLPQDPEIAARFEDVDMESQKFLLARSLAVILRHAAGVPGAADTLSNLAKRHGSTGLDIPERLYGDWKVALLGALAEFDAEFDEALGKQWQDLLDFQVSNFIRMTRL